METMDSGSIPVKHFDAMQVRSVSAEATLHLSVEKQQTTERINMKIETKIKLTIKQVIRAAYAVFVVACIGVGCWQVAPSA